MNITKKKPAAGSDTVLGDTTPKKGGRRIWRGVLGDLRYGPGLYGQGHSKAEHRLSVLSHRGSGKGRLIFQDLCFDLVGFPTLAA